MYNMIMFVYMNTETCTKLYRTTWEHSINYSTAYEVLYRRILLQYIIYNTNSIPFNNI